MRIINTMIQNIKNFLNTLGIHHIFLTLTILSIMVILFVGGALYQQYQFSSVYPLAITLEENSTDAWNSRSNKRGIYVASRSGTTFYPRNCSSANRIQQKNRVFFSTVSDATSLGFKKSSGC